MTDMSLIHLLLECRARLVRSGGALFHRSTLRVLDGYLDGVLTSNFVPDAAVTAARRAASRIEGATIDAGEVEIRAHPDGVQVRAWLLVPHARASSSSSAPRAAFAGLPEETREVLVLSVQGGFSTAAIARLRGISRRRVRRHLRLAIAEIVRASNAEPRKP